MKVAQDNLGETQRYGIASIRPDRRDGLAILRPTQVRDVNSTAVLRLFLAAGPQSRAEIAAHLGLTQGPVTRITAQLAERGLIAELAPAERGKRGRPRIPVQIVADASVIIGVHIGVEHIAAGLTDLTGTLLVSERRDYDGTIDSAIDTVVSLMSHLQSVARAPVLGAGVIIGGWVDSHSGVVRRHELLAWDDVPLRQLIGKCTDLPVFVESNVRAHATADIVHGATSGFSNFIHVFVGNVIEVAVVVDGRVRNAADGYGGAISEWPVEDGLGGVRSARDVLSDQALLRAARSHSIIGNSDNLEGLLARAAGADAGASIARELLLERALGAGKLIAQLNAVLAPELIVVSSGVLYLDGSMEALEQGLDASPLTVHRPPVRSGNIQQNALITSATTVVLDHTLLDPAVMPSVVISQPAD